MLALTNLGIVHTAISVVAVAAGIFAFIRYGEISLRSQIGKLYVWSTVLVCLTGFPIVEHGGFGKPHVLGVITLIVLAVAVPAGKGKIGLLSRPVEIVSYTSTFLFHMIPGFVETTTRLPVGNPLIKDREGPELKAITGVLFLLFLVGAAIQVLRLRSGARRGSSPASIAAQAAGNQSITPIQN